MLRGYLQAGLAGKAAQPLCMRAFLESLPFFLSERERENSLSGNFKPYDYEEQELRQKGILSKSTAPSRFLTLSLSGSLLFYKIGLVMKKNINPP